MKLDGYIKAVRGVERLLKKHCKTEAERNKVLDDVRLLAEEAEEDDGVPPDAGNL